MSEDFGMIDDGLKAPTLTGEEYVYKSKYPKTVGLRPKKKGHAVVNGMTVEVEQKALKLEFTSCVCIVTKKFAASHNLTLEQLHELCKEEATYGVEWGLISSPAKPASVEDIQKAEVKRGPTVIEGARATGTKR